MNLGRCPVCHSRLHLESMVQDECGRELIALMARLDTPIAVPLVSYLGLFRPENRDLANDRALKLARETLALSSDTTRLAHALTETTDALRAKGGAALKNHNYLKRVLENTAVDGGKDNNTPARVKIPAKPTRTESAISGFLGQGHE